MRSPRLPRMALMVCSQKAAVSCCSKILSSTTCSVHVPGGSTQLIMLNKAICGSLRGVVVQDFIARSSRFSHSNLRSR